MGLDRIYSVYFSGFSVLWNYEKHTQRELCLATVKVFFNVVLFPLSLALYGVSKLAGRCSKSVPDPIAVERIDERAQRILSPEKEEGEKEPSVASHEKEVILGASSTSAFPSPTAIPTGGPPTLPITITPIPTGGPAYTPAMSSSMFVVPEETFILYSDATESERTEYAKRHAEGKPVKTTSALRPENAAKQAAMVEEMRRTRERRSRMQGRTIWIDASEEALKIGAQRKAERKQISIEDALSALEKEGVDLNKRAVCFGGLWEDDTGAIEGPTKKYREIVTDILQMVNLTIECSREEGFFQGDNAVIMLFNDLCTSRNPRAHSIYLAQYQRVGFPVGTKSDGNDLINRLFSALKKGIIQDYAIGERGVEILL